MRMIEACFACEEAVALSQNLEKSHAAELVMLSESRVRCCRVGVKSASSLCAACSRCAKMDVLIPFLWVPRHVRRRPDEEHNSKDCNTKRNFIARLSGVMVASDATSSYVACTSTNNQATNGEGFVQF